MHLGEIREPRRGISAVLQCMQWLHWWLSVLSCHPFRFLREDTWEFCLLRVHGDCYLHFFLNPVYLNTFSHVDQHILGFVWVSHLHIITTGFSEIKFKATIPTISFGLDAVFHRLSHHWLWWLSTCPAPHRALWWQGQDFVSVSFFLHPWSSGQWVHSVHLLH